MNACPQPNAPGPAPGAPVTPPPLHRRHVARGRRLAALLLALAGWTLSATAAETPGAAAEREALPPARGRIVSLAPSVTETLLALGAGDALVGVTRYHPPLPEGSRAVRIGGLVDPSPERIVALGPDLVIGLPEQADDLRTMEAAGLATLRVDHHGLAGVLNSIRTLGRLLERTERAEALAADLQSRIRTVRARVRGRPAPRVLVVVGRDRAETVTAGVWVAGGETHFADLVEAAGGALAYDGPVRYASVTPEGLLAMAPEVILELEPAELPAEARAARAADWHALPHLPAVASGRVHLLTGSVATVPGPRIVDLLERMAALLHPPEEAE